MEEETEPYPAPRRFLKRWVLFGLLGILTIGFVILWLNRITVADNFVRSEFDKRDIDASYVIEDIGFRKQVIRDLVIGDPAKPDLTAELVEIGNSFNTDGAGINWVRAKGVQAFGRLADGKMSFGALDKFSDPEDESPLALPDIDLVLEQAQLRIDSDYGAVGIALNGSGNLHSGFEGELAAVSKQLAIGDCDIAEPSYFGSVEMDARKPRLDGPLRLAGLQCPALALSSGPMAAKLAVEIGREFRSWAGQMGISGGPLRYADYSAEEMKSTIEFSGDMKQSRGLVDIATMDLQTPYGQAAVGRVSGPFQVGYGGDFFAASFEGNPTIRSAVLAPSMRRQIAGLAGATGDTPIGPIAEKLVAAFARAATNIDLSSELSFRTNDAETILSLETLDMESRSGALMQLSDPLLLNFKGGNVEMLADGKLALRGGGMPDAVITLNDGSLARGFSGMVEMAAYETGSAKLQIPELRFFPVSGGRTAIDGRLTLTGPLAGGMITGLQLPIKGSINPSGSFAFFRDCFELQFVSLEVDTLVAGPTRTRLCPQDGNGIISGGGQGVRIAARAPSLSLTGSLGGTPLAVSSGALGYTLSRGLTVQDVALRLGTADELTTFDAALLSAAFGPSIEGQVQAASGQIAGVPLLMDQVEGTWRYEDGAFLADAQLQVRDEQQVERFRPLISRNVSLRLADGTVEAEGTLLEPGTQRPVASVAMDHKLESSTGKAVITVSDLTFDDQLQPEMLTPLTLGVIANVDGTVTGEGQINWDAVGDGVKSSGAFRTDSINLAAAFGPVTGLSGEIVFTDLLALETAPSQLVRMAEVNPGVAAFNGQLFYRLLPDYKMQVEGGQWPFAGGMLYLEPTILDLSEEAERRLEFTVVGVDAGQFLTQFDFENLTASGVFDGKLPMVFDQDGGRIAGGYLVARKGGGSLAYVGELTYEDMGTFANFAFNALKSLKYQELTIGMDGAIDGEIITEVKFSGLQQGDDAGKNFITKQLAQIPLEFNVRIQAPFMQLMSSAKAFYEPELLVGQNLPALLRAREERAKEAEKALKSQSEPSVQRRESDNER